MKKDLGDLLEQVETTREHLRCLGKRSHKNALEQRTPIKENGKLHIDTSKEEEEFEKKQQFKSAIMSDGRKKAQGVFFSYEEIKEKLECEELRRPNFLYELRFETLAGDNYVDFDMDSINNFTHELDPLELE